MGVAYLKKKRYNTCIDVCPEIVQLSNRHNWSELICKNEISWNLQSSPGDTAWEILNFKVCKSRIYWPLEFCPSFLAAKLFLGFPKAVPWLTQIFKSHLSRDSSVISFYCFSLYFWHSQVWRSLFLY